MGATEGLAVQWGVRPSSALWPVTMRILFVLDGRIDTSHGSGCFGLGYVVDTLRDPSFSWWVRLRVDVVRRDRGELRLCSQGDVNSLAPGDQVEFDVLDFKFTEPKFSLDDYDQVWFFGDYPANSEQPIDDPSFRPLCDDELRLLAEWMDRGGGVFAAGDHFNLGASMCSRVPRVRTMRRWTQAQGVPPMDGEYRHETLQHVAGGYDDVWEGDTTPQTIEPVLQAQFSSIVSRRWAVHPLLCAPDGVIDTFPDHMHEGEVIDDAEVEIDLPLDIAGYDRPEYPYERPVGTAEAVVSAVPLPRPTPHVVAYGLTTNLIPLWPPEGSNKTAYLLTAARKRFGIVGAYDGDGAGIGRVVVDSTWHHWFSYNLHGFVNTHPDDLYRDMQAYYRNVALWLATPAQRQAMLVAAVWGPVVSDPMAFPPHSGRSLWAIGQRVLDILGPTLSECRIYDLVASFFAGRAEELFAAPADADLTAPYPGLPPELAVRAIVGGIASALIGPARTYYEPKPDGRRLLDPTAIARHAREGIEHGRAALVDAIRNSAAASEKIAAQVAETFTPPLDLSPPIELVDIRVVAERIQLPDPADPVLADSTATVTVRVSLAGIPVATQTLEIEPSSRDGQTIEVDRVLYEATVQSGEWLLVELAAGTADYTCIPADSLRFAATLTGPPARWIGAHTPAPTQKWRLWYRVESTS